MHLPPYPNFPNITGEKFSLREILQNDIADIVEISFYNAIQATSLQEAIIMHEKINADYLNGNSIHWGIADNVTNKIIGTCGFYRGFENESGELGCVMLSPYRGKGFMTMAMRMAINFGKNTIGLKRIAATTTRENSKAVKLLERLNFVQVPVESDDEIAFELFSE